ncbi:ROK family protein [Geothrix sp. 21YS21S-4]|uniref:ROK family protein n=1 Tax=Geothrix sp. 21YS21S-4 TaxID=3068889 RepID=UPI0027BA6EBA|nr:ROK family protein [Geothrix sp. 21YS21S-4]
MDLHGDSRTVLTLDAGGTTFVFGAMRGGKPILPPVVRPSEGHDLTACLRNIEAGFQEAWERCGGAAALSFAFPGPADYPHGVIGDLANLPGFRGGVPLGPLLEARFGVPAFLNNDGDLFAYGEALGGLLPEVNAALAAAGSPKRYRHLFGATLGTGFGGGLVVDGRLFLGDNAAGAEIWTTRSKLHPAAFAEEGVAIRAVRRVYAEAAGLDPAAAPDPKAIFEIAEGRRPGDAVAAREAFRRLGEEAGNALAEAVTLVDALVVVGGGLSGAAPLFLPSLVAEMNAPLRALDGHPIPRTEVRTFNLEDAADRGAFLKGDVRHLLVPGTDRTVPYDALKRTGVGLSRLGTSEATALGAYAYALFRLDSNPTC